MHGVVGLAHERKQFLDRIDIGLAGIVAAQVVGISGRVATGHESVELEKAGIIPLL